MEKDVFEIDLKVKGGSVYSSFEIHADTDLCELEQIICVALDTFFNLEDKPE